MTKAYSWLNFRFRGQFEMKILIVRQKYFDDFDGAIHEPAIRSSDTGQRIPYFDSCQLLTTLMSNMCALSVSCVLKLARKYEIEH